MSIEPVYDCALIGGGLGGLTMSIRLAMLGHRVILFEKEQYPFHKVCGEYISLESRPYLENLGLELEKFEVPLIKKLIVSSPDGTELKYTLPLGGFGISRYTIDDALKTIALKKGVRIMDHCKVEDAVLKDGIFYIQTTQGGFKSRSCCGSFGKKSNLDVKWKRKFIQQPPNKLNNYIGVKYHIQADHAADIIALHNFANGYCGISKIDAGKFCLCYLTTAANLKKSGNSIEMMEANILGKNPHLQRIFHTARHHYSTPISISQISFDMKSPVEHSMMMVGDAAGMITPLCGNGMSMAMHAGKIASEQVDAYLRGIISWNEALSRYSLTWKRTFSGRLRMGRMIQRFFGKEQTTNIFIRIMKMLPALTGWLVKQTHGRPF